jgi:hypothetical protein
MCGKNIVCNELSGFFVGESAVQDTVGDGRVADRESRQPFWLQANRSCAVIRTTMRPQVGSTSVEQARRGRLAGTWHCHARAYVEMSAISSSSLTALLAATSFRRQLLVMGCKADALTIGAEIRIVWGPERKGPPFRKLGNDSRARVC